MRIPVEALRQYVEKHHSASAALSADDAERNVQAELAKIWRRRDEAEVGAEPSLKHIPRFFLRKPVAERGSQAQLVQQEVSKLARDRLREYMNSLVLDVAELDECWHLLKARVSPPYSPADERINYDDFCQVADQLQLRQLASGSPERSVDSFFSASHYLKFDLDTYGRISILHFFQWVRCKNAILRTRLELSCFDSGGDGTLTERELEMWIQDSLRNLPALQGCTKEFFPFYKVTAVRKFFFFLDPKRRGRVALRDVLASPILHEMLELRRTDLTSEEQQHNWFALEYAEMLYSDYLELDADQNGMLCVNELVRYRSGGITRAFVQRVFQECHTYRNKAGQNEIDYKSYLDFVLAMTYKGTPEALGYFFRLLDLQRRGRLGAFEVNYFFRSVLDKFEEAHEDPNCTVEDVQGEIFDMVKPRDPLFITLRDLVDCKVGDTVVGMLTDMHAFWQYDRREQFMGHENDEGDGGGGPPH